MFTNVLMQHERNIVWTKIVICPIRNKKNLWQSSTSGRSVFIVFLVRCFCLKKVGFRYVKSKSIALSFFSYRVTPIICERTSTIHLQFAIRSYMSFLLLIEFSVKILIRFPIWLDCCIHCNKIFITRSQMIIF